MQWQYMRKKHVGTPMLTLFLRWNSTSACMHACNVVFAPFQASQANHTCLLDTNNFSIYPRVCLSESDLRRIDTLDFWAKKDTNTPTEHSNTILV